MLLPQLGHAFEFVMPKAYHTTDAEGLYCAAQQIWLLNVRSGSGATELRWSCDFRFTPDSDRITASH
jgi:hypothetical protein